MNVCTQATFSSNINPGSSCLIYAEVAHGAQETAPGEAERAESTTPASEAEPGGGSGAQPRGARGADRPEATPGGGSGAGAGAVPRRRRGPLTSAALLPSPPNTLSSRPDPPSSHHVSSPLPPEGPRAREAGETERMAL